MRKLLLLLIFLVGCVPIITEDTISGMVTALAKDPASACLRIDAMLYGEILACRTNEPGSKIIVKPDGTLEIWHGAVKVPVDEKELKKLIEQLRFHEEWFREYVLSRREIPTDEM